MYEQILDVINIITAIVTAASIISAVTPTKKDDDFVAKVKVFIDAIALNFNKK